MKGAQNDFLLRKLLIIIDDTGQCICKLEIGVYRCVGRINKLLQFKDLRVEEKSYIRVKYKRTQ